MAFFIILCVTLKGGTVKAETKTETKTVYVNSNMSNKEIQNVLDMNKDDSTRQLIVSFAAGNYNINQTLFVYSNTMVKADSKAVFRLTSDTYSCIIGSRNFASGQKNYDKGGYGNEKNIIIDGGKWDGNKKAGEFVRFIHGSDIVIRNMTIYNGGEGAHLITLAGVKNGKIENCTLYGYHGKAPKEAIHLDIVHNEKMVPGTDRWDDTPNQNIEINGNHIYDYSRAVGSHAAVDGVYQKNVKITANNFHNLSEEAVKLYGFKDSTVANNNIRDADIGIRVYTYLEGASYEKALSATKKEAQPSDYKITIENNSISKMKSYGIQTRGINTRPLKGISIRNNTINNSADTGIMIYNYTQYSQISRNKIQNTGRQGIGIYYAANKNMVSENNISAPRMYGLYIGNAKKITVKNNVFTKSGQHGVCLGGGSDNPLIQANVISSAKGNGISINGSRKAVIKSNKISSTKNSGIALNSNSPYAYIAYNNIQSAGNQGIGIYSKGDAGKVYKNVINNIRSFGVFVQHADNCMVSNNKISNIKKSGIYIGYGKAVKVKYNTLRNTKKKPICISKCKKCNIKNFDVKITSVKRRTKVIKGKTVPKAKVYIKIRTKKYRITANKKGRFTKKIKKQKKGTLIYVTIKDRGANKTYRTVKVK